MVSLTEDFENTAAFRWLTSYAEKFGFVMPYTRDNPHGFIYEPWHWVLERGPIAERTALTLQE